MINICIYCKQEFSHERKQKYCSAKCFGLDNRTRYVKPCEHCGKDFESEPHKKRKYCSKQCAGAVRKLDLLIKICPVCKKEFQHRSCTDTKYCSQECAGLNHRTRDIRKCKYCQKEGHTNSCL